MAEGKLRRDQVRSRLGASLAGTRIVTNFTGAHGHDSELRR